MSSQKPAIVYVHGIGQHEAGYSDDWFAALQPHLTTSVEKYEVVWSDIVNARAMSAEKDAAGVRARTAAEETFRSELIKELESRKLRNKQTEADTDDDKPKGLLWGDSFSPDDFVRYMVSEPTREAILSRFDDVLLPLLQEGRTVHVISHSWGTVVAYEGLRRHDGEQPGGHVANLFVLGSALSIGVVQNNLLERVGDGRKPTLVDRFFNVDAGGDIIGGEICPLFAATKEFLRRKPTGCKTFFFTKTAMNFTCAHSSYFHSANTAVNRKIVARYINSLGTGNGGGSL